MAEQSKIEWTDATWNPITGCTLVDEGCRNCYAADLASTRLKNHPSRKGLARKNGQGVAKFTGEVRFNEYWLDQPQKWKTPRMIFVCAHGDLFHENVSDAWINQVFAVMALCQRHKFQVLTKRPDRAAKYLREVHADHLESAAYAIAKARDWDGDLVVTRCFEACCDGFPNIWLGTSVSDQDSANERIPHLLRAPAAVRFVSAEPMLGPVDLTALPNQPTLRPYDGTTDALSGLSSMLKTAEPEPPAFQGPSLDWVICGGESGRKARPMHSNWARALRDQCVSAGTAFHFKQWGMWLPEDQACPSSLDGSPVDSIDQWDWSDADERGVLHHWDDQSASIHLRKNEAGRFLDGREWNEVPA